jgi:hypothetical protein
MPPSGDVPRIITVTDTVFSTQCVLDTEDRVAHCSAVRMQPPEPAGVMRPSAEFSQAALPPGTESLGTQTIDGVLAVGTRTTETIPAGAQASVIVVTDTWTSPELHITMLRKTVDPRYGEGVLRIENFSRAEPDIALFQLPAGYVIWQETGSFNIHYSNH